MSDSFDAFRYMGYLRSRWRWIASSACAAVVLATVVSLLLPNQYTATARLLIEPPAGTDLRSAMAVSPIAFTICIAPFESQVSHRPRAGTTQTCACGLAAAIIAVGPMPVTRNAARQSQTSAASCATKNEKPTPKEKLDV